MKTQQKGIRTNIYKGEIHPLHFGLRLRINKPEFEAYSKKQCKDIRRFAEQEGV